MKADQLKGDYEHLFSGGVDHRNIFLIREDYERFKAYLYILNDAESVRPANVIARDGGGNTYAHARSEPLVRIAAYALLPTHFHILAAPVAEKGISRFMQKVITGYTMYFNARTIRTGRLFASSFKSRVVMRDSVPATRAYIHMTPAQFFFDDWKKESRESIGASMGKIATYPYASLHEYHSKAYRIVSAPHTSVTAASELRAWMKASRSWKNYFE